MTVRAPVLISTVTAIPGVKLTRLSSICIWVRSSEMRAAYTSSCPLGSLVPLSVPGTLSPVLSCGLSRTIASCDTLTTLPRRSPYRVKLKVSILISASCPGCTKPMSRFETMASISSRLALGTTTSRDCAGVTTPDRELLRHAVHRRGELLKPGLLLGLDQVLGEPIRLLLGLGEFVGERAPIFGRCLVARLANRGHRRLRRAQMALLNAEFLLLLDQQLQGLEIGELRAQLLVHERLADVDARLDDRDHGLELMDGGGGCGLLGLLLRLLTVERAELGAVLGHLVQQELTMGAQQRRVGIGGRREVGKRIVPGGQRRAQPRPVELLGEEVAAQVIAFRGVHGRIELDQHVAGLDRLSVLHPNGSHNPGLERLDDLGAAARHDLSTRRRNDVDRAPPGP